MPAPNYPVASVLATGQAGRMSGDGRSSQVLVVDATLLPPAVSAKHNLAAVSLRCYRLFFYKDCVCCFPAGGVFVTGRFLNAVYWALQKSGLGFPRLVGQGQGRVRPGWDHSPHTHVLCGLALAAPRTL